jgi:hypothetical protein
MQEQAKGLRGWRTALRGKRAVGAITLAFALGAVVLAATLAGGASAAKGVGLCSQIDKYGMTKQMNMHASQILASCGRAPAPPGGVSFSAVAQLTAGPASVLATDVNVIDGGEGVYPHVTQSETFDAVNGNTVVSAFNDSRTAPSCYAGGSTSTNAGVTFSNLNLRPFCAGHGTNFGDPNVVYNRRLGNFYDVDLASGCGGQGLGVWTSSDGITWAVGVCAHTGTSDDRNSMAVDNNPASPFYGRMYISYNNFATANADLQVVYSDNGTTWIGPVTAHTGTPFMRDVQITAASDGDVFLAGMDEGGGGFNPRTNHMFRSTNGGVSYTDIVMGAAVPAAGVGTCGGYFATMFAVNPFWRHMGWGNPGAGPSNVVHYVFAQHGAGADVADIMYTRSIDNGTTWSAPVKIDGDTTTRKNWQPSLSISPSRGDFLITWYDQRATTGDNYQIWGRRSTNNGASFGAPFMVSDVTTPLPQQNDPNVNSCYAGDYDMPVAQDYADRGIGGTRHFHTWVDGRISLGGSPGSPYSYVTSTSSGTVLAGGVDTGNHGDDVVTTISLPFSEEQYGAVFTTANVSSNGSIQFGSANTAFTNACPIPTTGFAYTLFPYWDDQRTDVTPATDGIFTQTTGSAPNRDFHIRWHTTYFAQAGTADYEVVLHENSNVETVIYGATADNGLSATAGIQLHAAHATQFSCNTASLTSGLRVDYNATGPPVPPGGGGNPQQDVFLDRIG